MKVYRITMIRNQTLGFRTWTNKRVIPVATRQRLGCILAYQRQLPAEERWSLTIEHASIGDFETLPSLIGDNGHQVWP